jgi:hypothetical protein
VLGVVDVADRGDDMDGRIAGIGKT